MDHLVKSSTLTEQIQGKIRNAIISGQWAPGELHSVSEIASMFGVSRTPAREAMLQLADAGLVAFERNVGFRILRNTPSQIAEIFHLRLLLEVPAAGMTARNASRNTVDALRREMIEMYDAASGGDEALFMTHDRAFHNAAIAGAGNARLIDMVERLRDATTLLGASTVDRSRTLTDIADEHKPIQHAIAARDSKGAADAMREHIIHTGSLLLAVNSAGPNGKSLSKEVSAIWDSFTGMGPDHPAD